MQPAARKPAPRRKALTARQQCALAFVKGMLAGPAGAEALKGEAPMVQLSRLSLQFADAFLAESEGRQ